LFWLDLLCLIWFGLEVSVVIPSGLIVTVMVSTTGIRFVTSTVYTVVLAHCFSNFLNSESTMSLLCVSIYKAEKPFYFPTLNGGQCLCVSFF
jgi:hypothetical protein